MIRRDTINLADRTEYLCGINECNSLIRVLQKERERDRERERERESFN